MPEQPGPSGETDFGPYYRIRERFCVDAGIAFGIAGGALASLWLGWEPALAGGGSVFVFAVVRLGYSLWRFWRGVYRRPEDV